MSSLIAMQILLQSPLKKAAPYSARQTSVRGMPRSQVIMVTRSRPVSGSCSVTRFTPRMPSPSRRWVRNSGS